MEVTWIRIERKLECVASEGDKMMGDRIAEFFVTHRRLGSLSVGSSLTGCVEFERNDLVDHCREDQGFEMVVIGAMAEG